jgi:hypothetical protein
MENKSVRWIGIVGYTLTIIGYCIYLIDEFVPNISFITSVSLALLGYGLLLTSNLKYFEKVKLTPTETETRSSKIAYMKTIGYICLFFLFSHILKHQNTTGHICQRIYDMFAAIGYGLMLVIKSPVIPCMFLTTYYIVDGTHRLWDCNKCHYRTPSIFQMVARILLAIYYISYMLA